MKKLIYMQVALSVAMPAMFFVSQARLGNSYISVTAIALLAVFFTLISLSTFTWVVVCGALRWSRVIGLLPAQFGLMYGVMAGSQFGLSLEVVVPTVISFVVTGAFFTPIFIQSTQIRRLEKEVADFEKRRNK